MTQPADEELIRLAAEGDQKAFTALYERYKAPVWRFARRMLYDEHLSSDVVQDTFSYFFRKLPEYRPEVKTLTFLLKVVRNRCLNVLEKRRKAPLLPGDLPEPAGPEQGPGEKAETAELAAAAAAAVKRLEPREREVLTLRLVEGLSYAEMAKILDVPEGTVKSRLHYSLESARKLMKGGTRKKPENP